MNILVIGRTLPERKTGMMGTFEFEQSVAVNTISNNVIYAFCDLRSVKWVRKCGFVNGRRENVNVYGCYYPIGGLPMSLIRRFRSFSFVHLLKRIISKEGKPDIIHIHFPLLTIDEKIWGFLKSLDIPIVITEHWTKVQTQELLTRQIELLRRLVEEANHFICVENQLKQSVIELTRTPKSIEVIPNMVSPLFNFKEKQNNNHRFEFITVGRLVEHKRFHLVVEAFSCAFPNDGDIHLTIVGDGLMNNKLKKMVEDLKMNDRIHMTGFLSREKTAEAIKNSNVFVSASILETFGVPAIEAMSCGKAVILADNSPIKEYINEEMGLLFEVDNIDSLVDAMKKVYQQRNVNNSYEIADFAKRNFSKEAIAEKLCYIYSSSIN